MLTSYINDKNSSSLREYITVATAGYEHNTNKLGYNGYKHLSNIGGKTINCEAKPVNVNTTDFEIQKSKKRLNGQGNFTDYTPERLEKDLKQNLNMLSSGFIDGELQYIIEYPFVALKDRLETQLNKHFKNKAREKGTYLRSASFTFIHYSNNNKLKTIYLNKEAVSKNEKYFNKQFFQFLKNEENEF
ncbi:MAG: hypothetical protein LRY27_03265 [Chitinophagales bacterium]|nr:hypothetical protein [Chitinophagales bacterium]